jgi:transcriptional regulator with XRE-family HTH domain
MDETFGRKLRTLRRQSEVTQRELAKRVGVDFSYISKLENDRLPPPAAETTIKICEALGVVADELLATAGKIPLKLQQSVGSSPAGIRFLRTAQTMELSEAEWVQLNEHLKRLRE